MERLTTSWAAFKASRLTDAKWCEPRLMVRMKHLAGSTTLRYARVKRLGAIIGKQGFEGAFAAYPVMVTNWVTDKSNLSGLTPGSPSLRLSAAPRVARIQRR